MKMSSSLHLILPPGFDEQALFELPFKGWLSAYVESEEGCRYPVHFSDPVRLQQDLAEEVQLGKPHFAMPGLIILPEVTMAAIEEAVQALWEQGFFAYLKAEQFESSNLQREYQFA
ncbi:MAG: hypothetical protein ACOYNY_24760 [Caldilineaceae bacterium]|jgi:hypothetical protein